MSEQDSSPPPPGTDLAKTARPASPTAQSGARTPRDTRAGAPERPALYNKPSAPVLVKLPPPFFVRLSQLLWIVSLVCGAAAVVYAFVIRTAQLPQIVDLIRGVDDTRADETYDMAADIIFWAIFGGMLLVLLAQIMQQVSFAARRPNVRWWQLGSLLLFVVVFLIAQQVIAIGTRGLPLERIMLLQGGLAVLGLIAGVMPPALRWTARKHDVRRGDPDGTGGSSTEL